MKKRLLIILNRLVIGGQSIATIPLAWYLQQDFDILILHGRKEKDEKDALHLLSRYQGLQIKKINSLRRSVNPVIDIIALLSILKVILTYKPHIVHTHGSKSGFTGRLAAFFARVPCIVHTFHGHLFHSYYNKFVTNLIIKTERILEKITSKIIALSAWQQHELVEVYKIAASQKVSLIYLGLDIEDYLQHAKAGREKFRKHYHLSDDDVAIGIIGRMVPVKNHAMFIKVIIQILAANQENVKFFFIGNGDEQPRLQHQLSQANITWSSYSKINTNAKVFFTSWINNIEEQVHGLDIIALTSVNEGTPLSLIEAQVCAKPVIATDVGGVKDTFKDNESGFLVPSDDIKNFAAKLQQLICDKELRNQMGASGSAFAKKRFSKQTEIELYKKLYSQCS